MSTAITTTAENAGLPAMLDTKDVAEMFKRCNLAVYAEARRIYYREVNLIPCKKYPKQVLQRIEWWFWDWFAYDCAVSGIGLTGNESEDSPTFLPFRMHEYYMQDRIRYRFRFRRKDLIR